MHFTIAEGFAKATTVGQMGWFFLMAVMYITGAGLYAARIPERFFPGKFDIWVRFGFFGGGRAGDGTYSLTHLDELKKKQQHGRSSSYDQKKANNGFLK